MALNNSIRQRLRHVARLRARRAGFTLVEMLVTVAVSLLIVFGLVQMFQWVGEKVADGRAAIEMAGALRGITTRLQKDLDGLTVPVRPWPENGSAEGYFEIYEGPQYDGQTVAAGDSITGDLDDVIMFTAYSVGEPFVGQVLGQIVTSPLTGRPTLICDPSSPLYNPAGATTTTIVSNVAEIVWWTRFTDLNGNGTLERDQGEVQMLHRRVLLIRPDIDVSSDTVVTQRPPVEFFNSFDLSSRRDVATGVWTTNSLADLTQRQNRFAHNSVAFPHVLMGASLFAKVDLTWSSPPARLSAQLGEDVMLSQVLSFDVRVYDPDAHILKFNGQTVVPGDPGWTAAKNQNPPVGTLLGTGCYVDLNYSRLLTPAAQAALNANFPTSFSSTPFVKSQLVGMPTYDTWSMTYERDGINQNGNGFTDEGTDGFDNDGVAGTDDPGERETSPPYPFPLRGVSVTIRAYEPDTRQIRQESIKAKFVPE